MTNLNSENVDVEFERYIDAYNLSQASLPVDNLLNKQKRFNPVSGRNDVVFRMGNGGYIKIGEEDLPPPLQPVVDETLAQPPQMMTEAMQQPEVATELPVSDIEIQGAQQFVEETLNEEQRRRGYIPTLEEFEAAGYSKEVVEAAGFGQPEISKTLTQEEIQQRLETGGIEIATTNPTIRGNAANKMSYYLTNIALQDLREELQAQGASERTIQETLRTRENELFGEAEVITNAIWGHKSGIGVADFTTAGIMDIQEGYRLYEQSLYTGNNTDRVFGLLLMAAGVGGLGAVAKAVKRKLPAIRKAIADLGQGAEARIAERGDTTLFSNPIEPAVDQALAMAGRAAGGSEFTVTRQDASEIFGEGSERVRYTDPRSQGTIEVVVRPDGSASVLQLEVPEEFRGQGIGQRLQEKVMQDYPVMGGQVSSKAAATTAYRLGRRPINNPDATLEDVFKEIDEMSSVNMISPKMRRAETRRQANIQRFGYDPNEAQAPDTSYRMEHQPRGPEGGEGIRLDDLTKNISGEQAGYPEDFYTGQGMRLYAQGPSFEGDEYGLANQESYDIITSVKGNPDAEVTIYRAVPDEDAITTINPGDFVTLSPTYAKLHAASGYGRSGDEAGKVLEQKVKVRDIYWDGNDVNEFGYFPEEE